MSTAAKNPYAKTVAKPITENAYEVWTDGTFTTYVLKSYQTDNTKPYARAFCLVESPYSATGALGDTYWSTIRDGRRIK